MTKKQKIAVAGIASLSVLFIAIACVVLKPDKEAVETATPYFETNTTEAPSESTYIEPEEPVGTQIEIAQTWEPTPEVETEEPMTEDIVLISPDAIDPETQVIDGAVTNPNVINGNVPTQPHVIQKEQQQQDTQPQPATEEQKPVVTDTFKYVALGNSVTCNIIDPSLWWSTDGMAATKPENDYVHIVGSWLASQTTQQFECYAVNIKTWELAADRAAMLSQYDQYLTEDTDVVTIQTGENITEHEDTLPNDYLVFFQHVRQRCPNAKIVVLGEVLWPKDNIEQAKQSACSQLSIPFINVQSFLDGYDSLYKSAMGVSVLGDDGAQHAISNEVVAAHPNDAGMAHIAQLFIDALK